MVMSIYLRKKPPILMKKLKFLRLWPKKNEAGKKFGSDFYETNVSFERLFSVTQKFKEWKEGMSFTFSLAVNGQLTSKICIFIDLFLQFVAVASLLRWSFKRQQF